jgi:hypothetical protein
MIFVHYKNLGTALKVAFPEFEWDLDRFGKRGKRSMQGWYEGERGNGERRDDVGWGEGGGGGEREKVGRGSRRGEVGLSLFLGCVLR